jgi:hypothetical protein
VGYAQSEYEEEIFSVHTHSQAAYHSILLMKQLLNLSTTMTTGSCHVGSFAKIGPQLHAKHYLSTKSLSLNKSLAIKKHTQVIYFGAGRPSASLTFGNRHLVLFK